MTFEYKVISIFRDLRCNLHNIGNQPIKYEHIRSKNEKGRATNRKKDLRCDLDLSQSKMKEELALRAKPTEPFYDEDSL